MKIGSIVVHCHAFDRMVSFWQEALGYVPREPARGGWVVLRDPTGRGPNMSFQAREPRRKSRSWLHLDLYTDKRDAEVERLVSLGASRHPWRYRPHADFVVLQDPDGNLFCVVQKAGTEQTARVPPIKHLRAKGVELDPPRVAPYGMKQLYLRDPDGYVICFQWPAA